MRLNRGFVLATSAVFLALNVQSALRSQQKMSSLDRERDEDILKVIRYDVKKNYYDPKYRGLNLDALCKQYEEKMKEAKSNGDAFTDIAAFLSNLHDSHTFFVPPTRAYLFDYGLRFQLIGDRAFITEVRPGSDASKKVHPGDEILSVGPYGVNRRDFHDLSYYLYQLSPQPGLSLTLRGHSGVERKEIVRTKFIQEKRVLDLTALGGSNDIWQMVRQQEAAEHLLRQRWIEMGDVLFWQMPEFDMRDGEVDRMMDRARKHKALVLDLRGNPGGSVDMLERLVGNVMIHDVTIATRVARKPGKPQLAKTRGKHVFTGKVIVLVDSRSASAAELFAHTMQLEHRGVVVGDRSAGAVMEARFYSEHEGEDTQVFYGVSVTEADLIMSDGKSLEGVGVTPDVVVLPSAADLAAGRDPALAKAAELAGIKLDPAAAGKLFPFEWAPLSAE